MEEIEQYLLQIQNQLEQAEQGVSENPKKPSLAQMYYQGGSENRPSVKQERNAEKDSMKDRDEEVEPMVAEIQENLEMVFDGNLEDIDQDAFKQDLMNSLKNMGMTESQMALLNIELRSGSIVVVKGPLESISELVLLP